MHLKEKLKDFGLVRVCEIIGGDSNWQRNSVTFNSLLGILPIESVINEQMIIDVEVNPNESENTLITIPEAVMNRLLIGDTLGLAILPLGAISVSFYSVFSNEIESQPTLYFNLEK